MTRPVGPHWVGTGNKERQGNYLSDMGAVRKVYDGRRIKGQDSGDVPFYTSTGVTRVVVTLVDSYLDH